MSPNINDDHKHNNNSNAMASRPWKSEEFKARRASDRTADTMKMHASAPQLFDDLSVVSDISDNISVGNQTGARSEETNTDSDDDAGSVPSLFVAQEAVEYLRNNGAARSKPHALQLLQELETDFKKHMDCQTRKWRLRHYKNCFVAQDAVTWLVESGHAITRKGAVELGRALQKAQIMEHVCGDHAFKDGYLFFRFLYAKPSQELVDDFRQSMDLQDRKYLYRRYPQCFVAQDAVAWLVERGYAQTREEAVQLGIALQRSHLFDHVCGDHEFRDGYLFFHFLKDTEKVGEAAVPTMVPSLVKKTTRRKKLESVNAQLDASVQAKDEGEENAFDFPFTLEIAPTSSKQDNICFPFPYKQEEEEGN